MFSIGQSLTAPSVAVKPKEPRREYRPRTYSEFVKGLKNNELPEVLIRPNQNIAAFEDNEGNYGDVQIIQNQDLWQTISESDANVRIDMKSDVSISDTISVFFLLTFIFFVFRSFLGGPGSAGPMGNPFLKNQDFNAEREITTRFSDVEG